MTNETGRNWSREGRRGDIQVQLTYPSSNVREGQFARLQLTDEVSGNLILEVELEPEHLMAMLSQRPVHLHAQTYLPNVDRLGKRMRTETRMIRREDIGRSDNLEAMVNAVVKGYEQTGWTRVTSTKVRDGYSIIARRWDADEEDQPTRAQCATHGSYPAALDECPSCVMGRALEP